MNVVVIDASTVVGWLMPDEPWHSAALAVSTDIASGRLEAIVAPNLRFEVCNAIVKAARRGRIAWDGIDARFAELDRYGFVTSEPFDGPDVVDVCRRYGLGWGDAHHALLARRLGVPLITADARLVRALQGTDIWVESIMDRPRDEPAD